MLKQQIKKNKQDNDQLQMQKLLQQSIIQQSNDIQYLNTILQKSQNDQQTQHMVSNRLKTLYQEKVNEMTEDQIDGYIKSHNTYDNNKGMEMEFFYKHVERILRAHINEVIQFTPENAPVKLVPINQTLINNINQYIYGALLSSFENKNYDLLEKQICNCLNVKFIQGAGVDLKDQNQFKQLQEFQQQHKYTESNIQIYYPTDYYNKKQGAYFNYFLTIPEINLNKQQIYNYELTQEELETQEHCFIHSLIQSNEYSQEEINEIKLQIVCLFGNLSLENIKKIKGLKPLIISSTDSTTNKVRYAYIYNNKVSKQKVNDIEFKTEISCYKNHYFINEIAPCTLNFVKHYKTYKTDERYKNFMLLNQVKTTSAGNASFSKYTTHKATVLELIKYLFTYEECIQEQYFKEKSDMNIFNQENQFDLTHPPAILYYQQTEEDQRLLQQAKEDQEAIRLEAIEKPLGENYDKIMAADFETFTTNGEYNEKGQLKRIVHKEFLLCYAELNGPIKHGRNIMSLINYLKNEYADATEDKSVIIYYQNFGYDASYIMFKNIPLSNPLKFNGKIISLQTRIYLKYKVGVNVKFVDSYLLFQCALKRLPKMFLQQPQSEPNNQKINLTNIEKEIFPYDYYTEQRYLKNIGSIQDAMPFVQDATYEQFKKSIIAAESLIGTDQFDMQKYALYYCKIDVDILRQSLQVFQKQIKSEFDLDITDYISISSLAAAQQRKQGCYEEVEPVNGLLRKYLQQFVVGGRCALPNNTKIRTMIELLDFDAVSLYPSAMSQIYFPTGKPEHLTAEMIKHYNVPENLFRIKNEQNSEDQNSLYMTIKFTLTNDFIPRVNLINS
ncbi:DNA_polymerase [Hexamita inflata]|uniref:DNA-directed DNA polymerase n=1 Tax=Hexamita inflata TaxID=28002 RepID=A0ABP1J5V1_9EUKA